MNEALPLARRLGLSAGLFCLLLAVYNLTFSGTFNSDDEHLLAAGALSWARQGEPSLTAVYGNTRLQALQTLPHYTDFEPGQWLLGSVVVRAADALGLGPMHALFESQAVVTALTGAVLLLAAAQLGYSAATALAVGLLFGLGTLAWPYALSYFRDPLAALCVAAAAWMLEVALAERTGPVARLSAALLFAAALAAGMAVKVSVGVVAIVLVGSAVLRVHTSPALRHLRGATVGLAGAGLAAAIGLSVLLPAHGPFGRLSFSYFQFLLDALVFSRSRVGLGAAILGPLISPGKSLFIYSPMLLLAVASPFLARGLRRYPLLTAGASLFGLILAQALFYEGGWAGFNNWGPRFLLPALPLLALACAPALENLRGRTGSAVIGIGVGLTALVQIPGVLIPAQAFYANLNPESTPEALAWNFSPSPLLGHWQLLLDGAAVRLAWVRLWPVNPAGVAISVAGWTLVLVLALISLRGLLSGAGRVRPAVGPVAALVLTVLLTYVTLAACRADPAYGADRPAFNEALAYLQENARPEDVVLVQAYGQPLWFFAMDHLRGSVAWYGLPLHFPTPDELQRANAGGAPAAALSPATLTLFETLPHTYQRVWLINALEASPGDLELEARWLDKNDAPMGSRLFSDARGAVRVSVWALPKR